jgi:hypothetical protein
MDRPTKITFGEMRDTGVLDLLRRLPLQPLDCHQRRHLA